LSVDGHVLARQTVGYALTFGLACAISIAATFLVRGVARRFGLVAKPRADRWHKKPTALFGGVGIFVAFVATYFLRRPGEIRGDMLLLACSGGMFLIGLVDDFVQLKPYAKLVGQIVFATLFTMFGMRLHWLWSVPLDQALTIFWLVGITNAINLLDNLDGLAGGVAAIAAMYLVYFCHAASAPALAATTAAFAGAVVGFLFFNFNPASIFMGDCGSLFLGFFLGGVSLIDNQVALRRNVVSILTLPVLLLLIPIVDTTLVTISRKLAGRRVSQGGRDHTSHRLVALGLSERAAAVTLWIFAAASGATAVAVRNLPWQVGAAIVPAFGLLFAFFAIYLGRVRVYAPVASEAESQGRALLPTLADFGYKRRVFEVLHDVVIVCLAYYCAFLLRFDGWLVDPFYGRFVQSLPVVLVIQLSAFLALGLYRGLWRYTSMHDLPILLRSCLGAWLGSMVAIGLVWRFDGFSRGALVVDGLLLTAAILGTRIFFRLMRVWLARLSGPNEGRRILIFGAGDGGELLVRELQNNRGLNMHAIGFVDDDLTKRGRMIHGVRVLGPAEELKALIGDQQIDELVISVRKLPEERISTIAKLCVDAGIKVRTLRIAFE
jgi:UDP-GlcNAc:undecaprenyl-phosphate GlcNAc-1-phosphate transferase